MTTAQERHDALGDLIRARAIAAGKYYPPTPSTSLTLAMHYETVARQGRYASPLGARPAVPQAFGMTRTELIAAINLIYPER